MKKAELESKLSIAIARIVEDGVTIENLFEELAKQSREIDRLRECFKNSSHHTESINISSYNDIQTKKVASRSRKGL